MTMNFETLLTAFDYKITSGSEYLWKCYPNARFLDLSSKFAEVGIVYSTRDQTIYEVSVSPWQKAWEKEPKPYRWLNPDYAAAGYAEAKERGVDHDQAWDDIKWVNLEVVDDFMEKARAMFTGQEVDTRILVNLELGEDEILQAALAAHAMDITLNKYFEHVLTKMIEAKNQEHPHCGTDECCGQCDQPESTKNEED